MIKVHHNTFNPKCRTRTRTAVNSIFIEVLIRSWAWHRAYLLNVPLHHDHWSHERSPKPLHSSASWPCRRDWRSAASYHRNVDSWRQDGAPTRSLRSTTYVKRKNIVTIYPDLYTNPFQNLYTNTYCCFRGRVCVLVRVKVLVFWVRIPCQFRISGSFGRVVALDLLVTCLRITQ